MNDVILFAGTTEGRLVAEACRNQPIELYVCVATEYGETLIEEAENIHVLAGRKDAAQMTELIRSTGAGLVIDATHPYAAAVTETIRLACDETGAEYLRLLRAQTHEGTEHCVFVKDTAAAVAYLNGVEGNVLLTVGSKELPAYTSVENYKERLFARVLPLPQVVEQAAALGFQGRNLIAMQGPFSEEVNIAMLKMLGARYLVTKDTGETGGFPEKIRAAEKCGVQVIVVSRPLQEEGISLGLCLKMLCERFGFRTGKKVTILGVGTGSAGMMTVEAEHACREAELIIGAKRLTESLARFGHPSKNAVLAEDVARLVREGEESNVVVAMSGDTGFFSGTKKLLPLLADLNPTVLPGISSVVYFCSLIGESWDDALLISAHGRECNYVSKIRHNAKVIALTGGDTGAAAAIEALCANGLGHVHVTVGSDLSYETEKLVSGTAEELRGAKFPPLAILLARNDKARETPVTQGFPDDAFLREEVPMTKQEVRAVTLAKLSLTKDAVCWDVGAGTGSVSLEMAACCEDGKVYAIEHKTNACALIEKNKLHLGITNVEVIEGEAPEALESLEAPTHVFIGGSSGNLKSILECVLRKNPAARIVMKTVTVESFAEATACLKSMPLRDAEFTELNVSRGRKLGRYNLMTAQNPVYVISCTGGGADA
ncbi:MAG: precorrin-6A reductase [Oscillospiraceae bacterium]|nr:precorrin-6A reductase [Oscillospiraceae bacterium]